MSLLQIGLAILSSLSVASHMVKKHAAVCGLDILHDIIMFKKKVKLTHEKTPGHKKKQPFRHQEVPGKHKEDNSVTMMYFFSDCFFLLAAESLFTQQKKHRLANPQRGLRLFMLLGLAI